MARIPDGVVERLKADISVQRMAEARGVELKRHGADLHGRCPFHDDKTPSLVITPAKNLWHCLGACQVGGTVIDWVMKTEGISFRHAVELLQNDYQPLAAASSGVPPAKHSTVKKLPMPIEPDAQDAHLLVQVIEYYHETLLGSPEALDYLTRRGIASEEAIRTFKLGFANRTLGYRLPATNRVEGAAVRGRLQRLGLLRASGHEHFNGSVVVPIIAPSGEVTEIYGRKITPNLREGTPLHLYLPGPHRGVWNAAALGSTQEVILCEALIDALTFWCAGYRNVTASYGVEGFTADHLALFKQCGTQRVLIAYDRNEAGDRAAEKLAQQLMAEGIDGYRIQFPKGMDANEYALKVTPASKSLGLVIRKAQWLGRGEAKPILTALSAPQATVAAESEAAAKEDIPTPMLRTARGLHPAPAVRQGPVAVPTSDAVPTLPCAALPAAAVAEVDAQVRDEEIVIVLGDRRYRVRGLKKNLAFDVMLKVNVLITRGEGCAPPGGCTPQGAFHVDTLDLYSVRARGSFITQAATELNVHEDVIRHDLGQVLRKLESLQERAIEQTLTPQDPMLAIPQEEAHAALALLKDPKLLDHILADFTRCGVVGEETNKLIGYLAATSRKLEAPLAVMVRSSSAAGKSSLMEAVLAFMPAEDKVQYSAMTGQSLFYMGAMDLKHKIWRSRKKKARRARVMP
jgi:DNA primase catalytic core